MQKTNILSVFWRITSHSPLRVPVVIFALFLALLSSLLSSPASATDYTASLSTSDLITLSGAPGTVIDHSDVTVTTNCKAGYNLTLSTSVNDNNLYLGGDESKIAAY